MPYILNDTERADDYISRIDTETEGIVLPAVRRLACKNVPAEDECDYTYETGISQTGNYKKGILNAQDFIRLVNETLKEADEAAKQGNQYIVPWMNMIERD